MTTTASLTRERGTVNLTTEAWGLVIDMQLLNGALLALLVVAGAAIALSLAMVAAATLTLPGQTPRGGTRRAMPPRPVPDDDHLPRVPVPDDDRPSELMLR